MKDNKILFVDIDFSLVIENTTFEFIKFSIKDNFIKFFFYLIITKFPINMLFKILYKLKFFDSKYFVLYLLKNKKKESLKLLAEEYIDLLLKNKKINKKVYDLILRYQKKKYKIVLLSNTLDILSNFINKKLKLDGFISSQLAYKDNFFIGKYLIEVNKLQVIKQFKNKNNILYLITDNKEDFESSCLVDFTYIVMNNKNKKFWLKKTKLINKYEFI